MVQQRRRGEPIGRGRAPRAGRRRLARRPGRRLAWLGLIGVLIAVPVAVAVQSEGRDLAPEPAAAATTCAGEDCPEGGGLPSFEPPEIVITPDRGLDVMTWNVMGDAGDRYFPVRSRLGRMEAAVKASGAAIVGLQESGHRRYGPVFRAMMERAGYTWTGGPDGGVHLFYKRSVLRVRDSGSSPRGSALGRRGVWAQFEDRETKARFVVVNVHLVNGKSRARDRRRLRQLQGVYPTVARFAGDLPTVWIGDFNSGPGRHDDASGRFLGSKGFVDSVEVSLTAPENAEQNSGFNFRDFASRPYGNHIDHIYVDDQVLVNSWRMEFSSTLSGGRFRKPFTSDHHRIIANLTFPTPEGS